MSFIFFTTFLIPSVSKEIQRKCWPYGSFSLRKSTLIGRFPILRGYPGWEWDTYETVGVNSINNYMFIYTIYYNKYNIHMFVHASCIMIEPNYF